MKIGLIFYYLRNVRYSFNSLGGALETQKQLLDDIQVYFAYNEAELFKHISESLLRKFKEVLVCFSIKTNDYSKIKNIIHKIKLLYNKNIKLIVGGPHITGNSESILELNADIGIIGEAEEVFLELLMAILANKDYLNLDSIVYKNDDKIIVNKRKTKYVNLDIYPPITSYFNHYGPIEITRGCPFACTYCQTSQIFGTKLRHRSIEKICYYVETMAKKGLYDTRFITPSLFLYGSDDGKNLNLLKLEELFSSVKKIINKKGKLFLGTFPSELRPEHITKNTVELLKKYADNDNVIVGVQTGSQRMLDICHRGHTVEDVYNAAALLTKAGFKVNLDFIFGFPYETKKDVEETINLIDILTTRYNCRIHAHIFTPLPGTKFENRKVGNLELYRECIQKLVKKTAIYGNYKLQIN